MKKLTYLGQVLAVRYTGSSTDITALQQWIDTGSYIKPAITTHDIRTGGLWIRGVNAQIKPGEYLIQCTAPNGEVGYSINTADEVANWFAPIETNYAVKIENLAHNEQVQKTLLRMGYLWITGSNEVHANPEHTIIFIDTEKKEFFARPSDVVRDTTSEVLKNFEYITLYELPTYLSE